MEEFPDVKSPGPGTAGKRLILVLGMHRSGTSVLIKALDVLGVELGDKGFIPTDKFNPRGYWENQRFVEFNDELLRRFGLGWDNVGDGEPERIAGLVDTVFFERARKLVRQQLAGLTLFALKDPRFSVLLSFWAKVFEAEQVAVTYVVAFRHPLSVVDSLRARDGIQPERAFWLWGVYNVRILSGIGTAAPILVDYDVFIDRPAEQLSRLAGLLGLAVDEVRLAKFCADFISPTLRHTHYSIEHLEACAACDALIRTVYKTLHRLAAHPETLPPGSFKASVDAWVEQVRSVRNLLAFNRELLVENRTLKNRLLNPARLKPWMARKFYEAARNGPRIVRPFARFLRDRFPPG